MRLLKTAIFASMVLAMAGCGDFQASHSSMGGKNRSGAGTGAGAAPNSPVFASAKSVLRTHCLSCHSPGGRAASFSFDLANESDFIAQGYIVPGKIDQSKLIYRLIHYSGPTSGGGTNMPLGASATSFPLSDYNILVNWVQQIQEPTEPSAPIAVGFECVDPSKRSASLSYVLTKTQYENTLKDLFGTTVMTAIGSELNTLPSDSFNSDTHARETALSSAKIQAYFNIAKAIAESVAADNTRLTSVFGSCATVAAPVATCIDTYLNGFARKIFRRPLSSDEISFAKQIANRGGDYKTNLKAVLSLHLQSPQFLWRLELGKPTQSSTAQLDLTSYEVATRLAYATTDSTPDTQLMQAAAAGQLGTVAQLQTQARRLLQTERGRAKARANLMRWSMSDRTEDFTSLPAEIRQSVSTTGLSQAMMDETSSYLNHMLFTQNASFNSLLTSKLSFASHTGLAQIYGHAPVTGAPANFDGRRQGLLMRAPFLTWAGARTSIIHRGVDFQRRVLCKKIDPPKSDVVDMRDDDALTPEQLLVYSNRDAVAHQTRSPLCMSCHATINPTGFAFENFDPFGRIRSNESIFNSAGQYVRSIPVNTAADVPMPQGGSVPVQDAFDLISHVASSSEGSACFSRHIYRYVNEKQETADDSCQLNNVQKIVADPNKSVLDALVEVIANDSMLVKKN